MSSLFFYKNTIFFSFEIKKIVFLVKTKLFFALDNSAKVGGTFYTKLPFE